MFAVSHLGEDYGGVFLLFYFLFTYNLHVISCTAFKFAEF